MTVLASTRALEIGRGKSGYGGRIILGFLCLVIVVAPFPLGAHRPWAWPLLTMAVSGLLLAWVMISLGASATPARGLPARAGLLVTAAWLVFSLLYLLPVPPVLLEWLAPGVHAGYSRILEVLPLSLETYYPTLDRHATLQALLKYCLYTGAFFLVIVLVNSRPRLFLLLTTLAVAGVVQVGLAFWSRAADMNLTPIALMDGHWDVMRGTFVNRNHFAAFLAMSASAGMGLVLANVKRQDRQGSFKARLNAMLDNLDGPVLMAGAAVLLVGIGMVASTSRGGVGALGVAVLLMLLLAVVARGRRAREAVLIWPLGLGALGVLAWSGSRGLLDRLFSSGLLIDERWVQWAGTRELIFDHWLIGTGPGTYQYAFTAYKDASLRPLLYDHAHNDYLQLLAEQGVVGFALLGTAVALLMYHLARSFITRHDMLARGALFASLSGMLAMLIHSLVEFNFQIPANALYFWVLAGMGVAATRVERKRNEHYGYGHRNTTEHRVVRS